jgi:hypothetical protein
MSRNTGESAVDRLIALAQKPTRAGSAALSQETDLEPVPLDLQSARELEHNPMWKALLQLRAFLPYIARLVEMSNPSQPNTAVVTAELRSEVRQTVGALESSHRDLRLAVQDQTVEIKRIEETITKAREATERNAVEVTELADDVRSMRSMVRTGLTLLVVLFLALIGSVIFLIVRIRPLLH